MNEFAELRHKIYLERTGEPCGDYRNVVRRLGRALLGDQPSAEAELTLRAAELSGSEHGHEIFDLIQYAGTSRYFDRYVADAVAMYPSFKDRVLTALGELPLSDGGEDRTRRLQTLIRAATARSTDERRDAKRRSHEDGAPQVEHDVSLVQCMFHGDPAQSGRGSSGGIATLLTELGNAVPGSAGGVVTLVLYDTARSTYPLTPVERVTDTHSIVRIPVELSAAAAPVGFVEAREIIEEAVVAGLSRHGVRPDVVHVRFLDDASLAAGRAAARLGARLVVTVTPDPHRQVCDAAGRIRSLPEDLGLEYLNKIMIGDELIRRAHGLLAIGSDTIQRELWPYYPQLEDTRGRVVAGIDEGVRTAVPDIDIDVETLLTEAAPTHRIDPDVLEHPTILTVGRLATVKNQGALVRAWAQDAWREYNLVLVGGDLENPSADEAAMMDRITEAVSGRAELAGRFCHLPGMPNAKIRMLQGFFAERSRNGQADVYVCPSLKEEFGLSILEAMASGLVVYAPLRGGAGSYIRHGVNGFLIDTQSDRSIADELESTLLATGMTSERARLIGERAAETVRNRYSVERIGEEFAAYYERVKHA